MEAEKSFARRCLFPPLSSILAGWSAKTTADGTTYYENHATKSTTWDRPVAPAAPPQAPIHRGSGTAASVTSSVGSGVSVGETPLPPGTHLTLLSLVDVVVVAVWGAVGADFAV